MSPSVDDNLKQGGNKNKTDVLVSNIAGVNHTPKCKRAHHNV